MKDFPGVLIVAGYLVAICYLFSDGLDKAAIIAGDMFRPNILTPVVIAIFIATCCIVSAINKNGSKK